MAERFTVKKCIDCSGGLEYNKLNKYWECQYCGRIYEKELRFNKVQIDGLAGINDLARSVLLKLSAGNLTEAEKDLNECEKTEHAAIATLIAKISVSICKMISGINRSQELLKANDLIRDLLQEHGDIGDDEEILYDFVDSNDIYGLLVIVYTLSKLQDRKNFIYALLDCSKVYSSYVRRYLVSILIKDGKIDEADMILNNMDEKECRNVLDAFLKGYPSCSKKAELAEKIFSKISSDESVSKYLNNYFQNTQDDVDVSVKLFLSAISCGIDFETSEVIYSVLDGCDTEENGRIVFETLKKKRLDDATSKAVLKWCIQKCSILETCKAGFEALITAESILEIEASSVELLFQSLTDEELKFKKLEMLLEYFKASTKTMDNILLLHLRKNGGNDEYRKKVLELLLERISDVPVYLVEKFVLENEYEFSDKAQVSARLLEKVRGPSLCSEVLSQYLMSNTDTSETRKEIIEIFLKKGIFPDSNALGHYIINTKEIHSEIILNLIIENRCRVWVDIFDKYIKSLSAKSKFEEYNEKIAIIATTGSFKLSSKSFFDYLLKVNEKENKKISNAKKYMSSCAPELKNEKFFITVGGAKLGVNITQAYFFQSTDDNFVIKEVIRILCKEGIDLNEHMDYVSDNKSGQTIKVSKFVSKNKENLDNRIIFLAKELL